jgi:hypothetical protein
MSDTGQTQPATDFLAEREQRDTAAEEKKIDHARLAAGAYEELDLGLVEESKGDPELKEGGENVRVKDYIGSYERFQAVTIAAQLDKSESLDGLFFVAESILDYVFDRKNDEA